MHPLVVALADSDDSGSAFLARATDRIVLGDALSAMRRLPDGCVDLIHTSPPYNIDKSYRASFRDRRPIEGYADFLAAAIVEMRRILRPNGSLFWQTEYTDLEGGIDGDILPMLCPLEATRQLRAPSGGRQWSRRDAISCSSTEMTSRRYARTKLDFST